MHPAPRYVITYRAKVAAALWPNRFKYQAQVSMTEYDQVVYSWGVIFGVEDEIASWVTAVNVACSFG